MKQVKNIIFLAVLFISFFVTSSSVGAQSVMPEVISATATGAGGPYNLEIYIPANTTGNLPAVVFIPGNGETGSNRLSLYNNGPLNFIKNSGWRPNFIVIGAQPAAAWPGNNFTNTVLNTLVSNPSYRIDQNKLYLTGLSGGAAAIDTYIKTSTSSVSLAAVVPMSITMSASCGDYYAATDYLCGNDLKWGNLASWGFAGSSDSHFVKMRRFFELFINAGYESRWTTYAGGHSGWNAFYDPTYKETINGSSLNIYEWMLQHSIGGNPPPTNSAPTSNAGTDQTITLPTSSVTLTGSGTDTDGTIASYAWTNISGGAATITSSSSASTTVTGLTQGLYTFRLTVTDNSGATGTDDIVVTVNPSVPINSAPVVNAGADQTITLPTSSVTLTGSATDPEGDSMTYIWTKVSGPSMTFTSPSSLSTSATGLTEGTYSFWLTATDSQGAVNADQIIVVVNAASGGGGGGTSTINGLVTRYTFDTSDIQWGSTTSEIRDTAGSAHGDAVGLSSTNAVTGKIGQALQFNSAQYIASSSAANAISPSTSFTVSAWVNTTAPLNFKTVFSKASVNNREMQLMLNTNGGLSGFVGGANNTNIQQLLALSQWVHLTLVNNTTTGFHSIYMNGVLVQSLAPGVTTAPGIDFLIGARRNNTNTDASVYFNGLIDDVRIYNRALSQSEISSIYNLTDISPITPPNPTDTTSPTTPTNLSATGTTQTQTTLSWSASTDAVGVSGYRVFRNGTQIATTATTSYTATGLTASTTYSFTVSAYDAAGNVSAQSTAVSVTTASTTNTAPTSNAGTDQTITLPTSSVTLTGSGSDTDGTISSYSWTKVSSLAGTITSPSSASTTITGLVQGTHTFRLTVTDNGGLTASDDVVIIVNPVVTTGGNKIFQIDFGGTPSGVSGWNDVLTLTANTIVNLVDNTNTSTSSSLQITNGFNAANYVGTSSSSLFPATTTSDSFFLGTFNTVIDDNAQLLISGLNNSSNYKFTFYGSRVAGDGLNRTAQYNIGSTTVELNATDNVNNVAVINGAVPSNGAITININRKSTATYGYLGLIKIEENASSAQVNQNPTSNAGTDQTITLPTSSVTLTGSGSDTDGTISSYSWTKVSTLAGTITSPSSASTTITGLVQGTHTFRLTVTDNGGLTASDDVVVVVSAAGVPTMCTSKKIVILGSSTAAGTGASPSSNSWAAKFTSYFNSLSVGNSVDNLAFSGYTTYNILPTGSTVPTGFTVGTGSNITAAISRNPCAIIINMPSNDEANNISIATQQSNWEIIATSAQNANIPIWVTTTQPREWPLTNQGRLNLMTMRDWLTTRFGANSIDFWTTVANADGTVNPIYNSDGVHVNNLGHDLFYNRVRAENIPGTTASTANTAPTSNAGTDQTITLPTSSVTLTGSGSDTDGTISSYSWTKVSTLAGTITSPSSASTTITGLVQGTHTFRLTVTDNGGLTASDDVVVVVNGAGVCKSVSSVGIIPSGGTDFWYMGNFNTGFNLNPCDTVILQAGTYGRIDIGVVDGITFVNNGQVIMNSFNLYSGSKNVKLLGNGTPGIQYGIKINGANSFATYWKATGELEIAYVEVVGTAAGIEVKHPPGEAYTQNFANVKIHDNYIHDHRLEGMYIGMDNLSLDVLINAEIYNNIVRNSGNDGIQTRNGTFNIHDNVVDNVALSPAFPYDINGILVGGNTKNSTIHNNTISRVPGTAIFNNGWGNHTITCNVISSNQPGIFTKNYEFLAEDLQNVGFQNFNIQNNTITSTSGFALQTYYNNNGSTTTTNFSNNRTSGSVDAQYSIVQSNNNINVVPSCSGPTSNSAPTSNAGTDQTITLPTSSVTLTGSGTDVGGSISSYSWTKVSTLAGTITSPSSASTTITGLVQGTHTFRLTVTDNGGLTASDDVVVVVNGAGVTTSIKVGPGEYQTAFIDANGYLWAVGNISNLGTGGAGTVGVPQRVKVTPLDLKFKEVAGGLHGLGAIDINGSVWMFGDNDFAQHGQGNTTHPVLLPQKILTDSSGNPFTNIKALALGYRNVGGQNFQVALKEDGTIWAWGYLKSGLLGNGTNIDQLTTQPVQITLPGGRLAKQIIAGTFIMALATDGTVWSWGDAGSANLGYTVIGMDYATPHQIPGLSNISQIAGGLSWNYALSNTGVLYGWGSWGDYLGLDSGLPVSTPTVLTLTSSRLPGRIQKIITNSFNTYVILEDKSLWAWGNGGQGSVGNGQKIDFSLGGNPFDRNNLLVKTPYNVAPTKKFNDVFGATVYTYYVYAVDDAGQLYSWGRNKGSVLSDGVRSAANGALDATYGNSWDVAWPTPVNPFTMTTSYIMTASACIANPTVSPCSMYTIPVNISPVANAGIDQSVTGSVATLNGVSSTDNVFIPYYEWSQVSGPNTALIDLPASKTPKVSGLVTGIYVFKLKVTDTGWATHSDTIQIAVNGATPINQITTVNVGTDQSIVLPANTVTLSGIATTGGTISSYSWTKTLGNGGVITSPTQAATTITGLTQGIYTFRLTVTDNLGSTAFDDVSVVVNTPGFTLSAGTNQTINLPTSAVSISAVVSGGTTASTYSWTKVSGPSAVISSPSSATTSITDLSQGTYDFQVTVTDIYGRVLSDTVRVTVNGTVVTVVNSAPTVNAGPDSSTTATSITLNASASDPEGNTMTYVWSQVFGINASTITNPNSLSTTISGLRTGTYTFSFSATDSLGATSTDTINVVVISTSSGGGGGGGGGGNGSFVNPVAITPTSNTTQTSFPELQVPANTNPSNSAKVNVVKLNVRSSPINGQVLNTIPKNTEVTVLSQNGSWSQILLSDGTTGWVFGSYITNVTNTSPSVSIPTSSSATVITTKLNVRSSPSTGKVLTSVSRNTIVNVISQNGSWANVSLSNGITGWVYAPYIKAVNTLSVGSSISVSTKLLNIRSSPIKGSVVKTVSQGSTGKIIDGLLSSTTWVNVLFDDGTTGYVYKAYLKAK